MRKLIVVFAVMAIVVGLVVSVLPVEAQLDTGGINIGPAEPNAPPGYEEIPYYLVYGHITMVMSVNGSDTITETEVIPSASMVIYVGNISGSSRPMVIDHDTFSAAPVTFNDLLDGTMTLTLDLAGDATGDLYVEDFCDVDVYSTTNISSTPETMYSIGDGSPDDAGSALLEEAPFEGQLLINGSGAGSLPMYSQMTTNTSGNLVISPGHDIDGSTISTSGETFLQFGGVDQYVGTPATLVMTGAALSRQIRGEDVEYQFEIKLTLSPSPVPTTTVSPTASTTPTPTLSVLPTASATATDVPTVTPTLSPTPTPTLAVLVDAPAEVEEDGNFSAQVDIINLDMDPGNYSASYVLTYNANIIRVVNVSAGLIGSSSIPVTNWSFVTPGVQGVLSVVQNISATAAVTGSGYLAEIDFDVVGTHCNTSDIDFNKTVSRLYVLPSMTTINAAWFDDEVHVVGPTPTPTAVQNYSLTVNQTSSCCNVSVDGYGNVTAGNSTTWSNISSGTVISVNASYNASCDVWGNWTAGVNNVSAMNTTVTMSANRTITANCSYSAVPVDGGGSGTPVWVWPVVGVMLFATLGLFIYALYRGGYLDNLMPRLRGWFGGDIEDYVAPDFEDEDMYDNLYGDTGPGIGSGTGGGTEMDDDLI